MGIDYNGVGGIGIRLNDEMIEKVIEKNMFTEEDWDDDMYGCVDSLGISYSVAGDSYNSEYEFYYLVKGENLEDINKNKEQFLHEINSKFNTSYTEKDLKVISELHIW